MIRFLCPSCNKRLKASTEAAGKFGRCTKCNTRLQIPMPSEGNAELVVEDPPSALAEKVPPQPLGLAACPHCGFSYRWDGVSCGHCHYSETTPIPSWSEEELIHALHCHVADMMVAGATRLQIFRSLSEYGVDAQAAEIIVANVEAYFAEPTSPAIPHPAAPEPTAQSSGWEVALSLIGKTALEAAVSAFLGGGGYDD